MEQHAAVCKKGAWHYMVCRALVGEGAGGWGGPKGAFFTGWDKQRSLEGLFPLPGGEGVRPLRGRSTAAIQGQ